MPKIFKRKQFTDNYSPRVVSFNDVNGIYLQHNLIVKLLWSGIGHQGNNLQLIGNNSFDDFYWDELAQAVRDPQNDTTFFGDTGSPNTKNSSADTNVDRTLRYNPASQSWQQIQTNSQRGSVRQGKTTTKSRHFTLYAPRKNMPYCRGIDPSTGLKAGASTANYDSITKSFPGLQIGILCNVDPSVGTDVAHCCKEDMYGRRLTWLGGAARVKQVMPYGSSQNMPKFMTIDELRKWQNKKSSFTVHNDCRVKLAQNSPCGILIPDGIYQSSTLSIQQQHLALFNAIYRKLKWLTDNGNDLPIVIKTENATDLTELSLKHQWHCLYKSSTESSFSAVFSQVKPHLYLMPLDKKCYRHLKKAFVNEQKILEFVCQCYDFNTPLPPNSTLNSQLLQFILQQKTINLDLVCNLLNAGCPVDKVVISDLMAYLSDLAPFLNKKVVNNIYSATTIATTKPNSDVRKQLILINAFDTACIKYNNQSLIPWATSERGKTFGLASFIRHASEVDDRVKLFGTNLTTITNTSFLQDTYTRIRTNPSDWSLNGGHVHSFNSYFLDEILQLSPSLYADILENSVNVCLFKDSNFRKSDRVTLYRVDDKKPEDVFKQGFENPSPNINNNQAYISNAPSASRTEGILTFTDVIHAHHYGNGHVYQISIPKSEIINFLPIDLKKTNQLRGLPNKRSRHEINFIRNIPGSFVVGTMKSASNYQYRRNWSIDKSNQNYDSKMDYPIKDLLFITSNSSLVHPVQTKNNAATATTPSTSTTSQPTVRRQFKIIQNQNDSTYNFQYKGKNTREKTITFKLSKGVKGWAHFLFNSNKDANKFVKKLNITRQKDPTTLKWIDNKRYPGFYCMRLATERYERYRINANGNFTQVNLPEIKDIQQLK